MEEDILSNNPGPNAFYVHVATFGHIWSAPVSVAHVIVEWAGNYMPDELQIPEQSILRLLLFS